MQQSDLPNTSKKPRKQSGTIPNSDADSNMPPVSSSHVPPPSSSAVPPPSSSESAIIPPGSDSD